MEVSSLLARVLISADEEVQAVQLLHDALEDVPMDYALLDCQAEFCQSKGEGEMALECAKRSVTAAPSEFSTWARLAEVYVTLEKWDLALLTLNSCPMFTYQDKDAPRMPQPSRVLLPIMPESVLDEIDDGQPKQGEPQDPVHPTLRKLHAATYQGTFLKAYNLLTKVVAAIGWDQLLKVRSEVFVMEEEYRVERQTTPSKPSHSHNASTVALHAASTSDAGANGDQTEAQNGSEADTSEDKGQAESSTESNGSGNGNQSASESGIEKPEQTVASAVVKSGGEDVRSPVTCALSITADHIYLFLNSPTQAIPHTHSSRISDSVSDGLITRSWYYTRICVFTPSGEPKWHNLANSR